MYACCPPQSVLTAAGYSRATYMRDRLSVFFVFFGSENSLCSSGWLFLLAENSRGPALDMISVLKT
jgi:hypothetical protein